MDLKEIKKVVKEEIKKSKTMILEAPDDAPVFTNAGSPQRAKMQADKVATPSVPNGNVEHLSSNIVPGFIQYNAIVAEAFVEIQSNRGDLGLLMQKIVKSGLEQMIPDEENAEVFQHTLNAHVTPQILSQIVKLSMLHALKKVHGAANEKFSKVQSDEGDGEDI